tara:strand:+ start:3662 stop:5053 length:1392 start_codon:yes stop_codon:yes gene_type:complete
MVAWFIFIPIINSPQDKLTEDELDFNIVIDSNLIPDCSVDNPLCRDQIDALSKLEEYIKTQNILIKYPVFNGNFFEQQKKIIQKLKKEADMQFFENYFYDAAQKYVEANSKLLEILNSIESDKSDIELELNSLFSEKKYKQMYQVIDQLKEYSFDESQIEDFVYKSQNGAEYDRDFFEAFRAFNLEKYEVSLKHISNALTIFPKNKKAINLKEEIEKSILDQKTSNAVAEIKSLLFKSNLTIDELNKIFEKVKRLKLLNQSFNVEAFYKEINDRKDNVFFKKYNDEAVNAFEAERFEKAISSFNLASKIRTLEPESKEKLDISKDILDLLKDFNDILYGNYDLKKQSNLDLLKNKILESGEINIYSLNLAEITKEAERVLLERNKFIKIKFFSNKSLFIDIGILELGNFKEKEVELKPGYYDILIKRRGMSNSRLRFEVSSFSLTQIFRIACLESICTINEIK